MVCLNAVDGMEITILCDNTVSSGARSMLGEHGFAALIRHGGEAALFDTGQTGIPLINNLKVLRAGKVEEVVLSHGHYDHSGGLPRLIESDFAPSRIMTHRDAFFPRYKKVRGRLVNIGMPFDPSILRSSCITVSISSGPQPVKDWLVTTGEIGRASFEHPETEFFIDRGNGMEKDGFQDDMGVVAAVKGKGLVVVTGCAHSGVINTVDHAMRITGVQEVCAVIGGFHLNDAGDEKLRMTTRALREREVKRIIPCHCTGFNATSHMSKDLGAVVEPGCVGMRIML